MKRLEFQRNFQPQAGGIFSERTNVLNAPCPLIPRRDHFLLPDIFAQHQQQVARFEFINEVQVSLATLDVEPLNRLIEVDESKRDAGDGNNGKTGFAACVLNQPTLFGVDFHRVGENIDAVESDLLRLANAFGGSDRRTEPSGVNESKFHDGASVISLKSRS